MDNLKFILVSLIVLVVVGIIGYWAFITIEPGDLHAEKVKEQQLEDENTALTTQITTLNTQIASLQAEQAQLTQPATTAPATTGTGLEEKPLPSTSTASGSSSKYQSLINSLQQLVTANVSMKVGSTGTRVGTIETFLNIYDKTSQKIDNDYGANTKANIANFQKAQGLTADGAAGATTFQKMIDWLNKQS
jgi:peptidoglycan hydrolase-like protein with peptidoglycan-binding domain